MQGGNCGAPCEVSFTSTALNVSTYAWNFGDNERSTEANPKHTYQVAGTYSVSLTVTGAGGTKTIDQPLVIRRSTPTKVWDKTIGGTGSDALSMVVPAADGGYLLGGWSTSDQSADKSEPSRGKMDYWVVKVNVNGDKQWEKTFGGTDDDDLVALVATPDGGFLLGGISYSGQSADKSEPAKSSTFLQADYWIVKINANGTKQWDKTLGGSRSDVLNSMVATPDGGFLLGGNSYSDQSADKSEGSRGKEDYWIVKISGNGAKQWDKTFGGSGSDIMAAVVAAPDGGFLLGGLSDSGQSGDKSTPPKGPVVAGLTDYWVVKISATGEKQWDKTIGGAANDDLTALLVTADGGFLLGGNSESNRSGDKSEDAKGGADFWVVKLDASGTKQWDSTIGGNKADLLQSMITNADGSFLIGGSSISGQSADKSEPSKGDFDYWLVKLTANGLNEWDKAFGGTGIDLLRSLVALPDRSTLLAGDSDSSQSGDKSETSRGKSDFWVIKVK